TGPNDVIISGGPIPLLNGNPVGNYDFTSQSKNIVLATAFAPGGSPLAPGQSVFLQAPSGSITLTGGSITGGSQVKLTSLTGINLDSASIVSASGNVLLQSDDMDIRGPVIAGNNIYVTPLTVGRAIDLGGLASPGSAMALDSSELAMLIAPGLGIGS